VFVEIRADGRGLADVVEALLCGLPVAFRDVADNAEVVGFGGIGFHDRADAMSSLHHVADSNESLRAVLTPPTFDAAAAHYAALIHEVATGGWSGHDALDAIGGATRRLLPSP
jgi:hypothetical protein